MHEAAHGETPVDPASSSLLVALETAGARGITAAELALEKPARVRPGSPPVGNGSSPRRALLKQLLAQGRVRLDRGRYRLHAPPDVDTLAGKLLDFAGGQTGPVPNLWRKRDLARALAPTERTWLDTVLARLAERREMLQIPDGTRGERFLFAAPLRRWLDEPRPSPQTDLPNGQADSDPAAELFAAYTKAVRASGGFPDVKISTLHDAVPPGSARILGQTLRALWYEGRVTLSLGDWSLASEEARAAAVELDGERYLLVRFEDPADEPPSA